MNSETIEPDPQAAQGEAIILRVLKTVEPENALSLDQILAKEPRLKGNTAQRALEKLVGAGKIGRTGNGQDKPYLYYNPQAAEERKIAKALPIISGILQGVREENALSLSQLVERRPDLNSGTAKKAVEQLVAQGEIKRTSDDRYYDRSRGGHGG
jgi:predicted transcriptional regulator